MNKCPRRFANCHSTHSVDYANRLIRHCCGQCRLIWAKKLNNAQITPSPFEVKSKYGKIKDWLVENYATRQDVDAVYGALCELLDVLDRKW